MVFVAADVVDHALADGGGDLFEVLEEAHGAKGAEGGVIGEEAVGVVDVGLVVAAVVELHGARVEVGFQSIGGVGEGRESERGAGGGERCGLGLGAEGTRGGGEGSGGGEAGEGLAAGERKSGGGGVGGVGGRGWAHGREG